MERSGASKEAIAALDKMVWGENDEVFLVGTTTFEFADDVEHDVTREDMMIDEGGFYLAAVARRQAWSPRGLLGAFEACSVHKGVQEDGLDGRC